MTASSMDSPLYRNKFLLLTDKIVNKQKGSGRKEQFSLGWK